MKYILGKMFSVLFRGRNFFLNPLKAVIKWIFGDTILAAGVMQVWVMSCTPRQVRLCPQQVHVRALPDKLN